MNTVITIVPRSTNAEPDFSLLRNRSEYTPPVDYITCTPEEVEKYKNRREKKKIAI